MGSHKKKKGLFLYLTESTSSYQVEISNTYGLHIRPKLGLLYLTATLQQRKNVDCDIWDQTISFFTIDQLIKAIDSGEYLFVGFYSAISMESNVIECIKRIRQDTETKIPILVGGPSFPNAEQFLRAGGNIVCNGEGEETICEIYDYITGNRTLEDIKGITYISDGNIILNNPRPLIPNIDKIPFPDYSRLEFKHYCNYYTFTMKKPYMTMITSRGCPYNCSFCDSHALWGSKSRVRSVDNVLAEIDELVGKYKVRYIAFQDDVFGLSYDWADEFCDKLIQRNYPLSWMCILHPFSFKKNPRKMLQKLRRAGCDLITTGLQSAHPEILTRLNRNQSEPEYIRELVNISRSIDMLSLVSFIFGSPGETLETIQTSIRFAMETKPNYAKFYNMEILPGSHLARQYKPGTQLCEFTKEELGKFCRVATRKFYLHPVTLSRNVSFMLRHNPTWLLIALKFLPTIVRGIGLGKKNESSHQ